MPETDLDLLIRAARKAGEIATRYSGKSAERWEKPEGAGPVTEADLAVNEMLVEMLPGARPGYGWLSEESEDTSERLSRDRVFIVDPIDGTRNFVEGGRTWAHSLAVARKGTVTAAVIYLPMRDLLYAAEAGKGATLNGEAIALSKMEHLPDAEILAARPVLNPSHWSGGKVPDFHRAYRPSLAYRMATVAAGRFDGMLTLRPSWEWDIAAGDLILREAGGVCTDPAGAALTFNHAHPQLAGVVAANDALHSKILAALGAVRPTA